MVILMSYSANVPASVFSPAVPKDTVELFILPGPQYLRPSPPRPADLQPGLVQDTELGAFHLDSGSRDTLL